MPIDVERADKNGATLKQPYLDLDMPDALREAHDSLDATVNRAFSAKTTCVSADERKRVVSTSYAELTSLDNLPIPLKVRAKR